MTPRPSLAILVAAGVLLAAGPSAAQAGAAAAPPAADVATPADEAALDARAEAFRGRLRTMGEEMAVAARFARPEVRETAVGRVEARYRPEIEAFKAEIAAFVAAHPGDTTRWNDQSARAIDAAVTIMKQRAVAAAEAG